MPKKKKAGILSNLSKKMRLKDIPKPGEWVPNAKKYYKKKIFGKGFGGAAYQLRKKNQKKDKTLKEIDKR